MEVLQMGLGPFVLERSGPACLAWYQNSIDTFCGLFQRFFVIWIPERQRYLKIQTPCRTVARIKNLVSAARSVSSARGNSHRRISRISDRYSRREHLPSGCFG
jgi:hypothetical protein